MSTNIKLKAVIVATLATVSITPVNAGDWGMEFGSQGKRKLQYESAREHCPPDKRYVFSHEPGGETMVGCWKPMAGGVMITWKSGDSFFHEISEKSMATMRKLYEANT